MYHAKHLALFSVVLLGCATGISMMDDSNIPTIAREIAAAVSDESNHEPYADLIRNELAAAGRAKSVVCSMPCFWSGEGHFGLQPGVIATTPGFLDGREVVEVIYDPNHTDLPLLLRKARHEGKANRVYCRDEETLRIAREIVGDDASLSTAAIRPDDQPKWYLRQTGLRRLAMTPAQLTRINALLHARQPIEPYLSPTQRRLAKPLLGHDAPEAPDLTTDTRLITAVREASR